jgi:hypothetical protein
MFRPGEKQDQADSGHEYCDPDGHPLKGVHKGINAARTMP